MLERRTAILAVVIFEIASACWAMASSSSSTLPISEARARGSSDFNVAQEAEIVKVTRNLVWVTGGLVLVTTIGVALGMWSAWGTQRQIKQLWERFATEQSFENALSFVRLQQSMPQQFFQDILARLLRRWPDLTRDQRDTLRRILAIVLKGDSGAIAIFDGQDEKLKREIETIEDMAGSLRVVLGFAERKPPELPRQFAVQKAKFQESLEGLQYLRHEVCHLRDWDAVIRVMNTNETNQNLWDTLNREQHPLRSGVTGLQRILNDQEQALGRSVDG